MAVRIRAENILWKESKAGWIVSKAVRSAFLHDSAKNGCLFK